MEPNPTVEAPHVDQPATFRKGAAWEIWMHLAHEDSPEGAPNTAQFIPVDLTGHTARAQYRRTKGTETDTDDSVTELVADLYPPGDAAIPAEFQRGVWVARVRLLPSASAGLEIFTDGYWQLDIDGPVPGEVSYAPISGLVTIKEDYART